MKCQLNSIISAVHYNCNKLLIFLFLLIHFFLSDDEALAKAGGRTSGGANKTGDLPLHLVSKASTV